MDAPPINVFGTLDDCDFVHEIVSARFGKVKVESGDDGSSLMVVYQGDVAFLINVHPTYFSDDDHIQRRGLLGYLDQFAMTSERKNALADIVGHLTFAVSFVLEPNLDEHPYLDLIHQVAERSKGVIFEPQEFKDDKGRILASQGGDYNRASVFPDIDI